MFRIRLVPAKTNVPFVRFRLLAFAISGALVIGSMALFGLRGLNYGIDFQGGILIEVGTPGPADIGRMRNALGGLGLGEIALQGFGRENDVLIRIERQPGESAAQQAAVDRVKEALTRDVGGELSYRRVEFVGPKVSEELVRAGTLASVLAVVAMLIYIWFRFEWQFGVGAVIATIHDVVLTIGVFALTHLEFNLTIIAAILTIVGYSVNDTVVVYDRIRENLRRFRRMPLGELLDLSINDTLSRTTMTSGTTLIALLALFLFGGEVIKGFTFAMIWGVVVGTYSSIFVAAPLLLYFGLRRDAAGGSGEAEGEGETAPVSG
jgi:preprotein translocase SecF subunit